MKHVALLRGINVGGKNKLAMKDLARLFTDAGCEDVQTFIQSGNVVYGARPKVAKTVAGVVQREIEAQLGLSVPIVVRTAEEMKAVIAQNPYPASGDIDYLHVAFLGTVPTEKQIAALDPARSPPDEYVVRGHTIYLRFPNGVGRTKLSNAYFDSVLSTVSTMRNWRTVNKLIEMVG